MKNEVVAEVRSTLRHRAFLGTIAFIILSGASAQTLTVSLDPVMYGDYNVSCFGKKDGAINATVTGGLPPYKYLWTRGDTVQNILFAASGYYKLTVTDANSFQSAADITLIEPEALKVIADPFKYPNGSNISCYECYNGSIDIAVFGGVAPYSYAWSDGPITQDRTSLGSMKYQLTVTDALSCTSYSEEIYLTQPDRNDWTMGGNSNTDPETQYIGTSDSLDLVLKTNGQEVLRLKRNGDISLLGNFLGEGPLFRMEDGTLRGGGAFVDYPFLPPNRCRSLASYPYWETRGNAFLNLCEDQPEPLLGTLDERALRIITNGEERIHVSMFGKVGIGTVPPVGEVDGYRLYVEDGIATRDVLVKLGDWPDYVFAEGYHLMPLSELKTFLATEGHLPGIPSADEVDAQGGFEMGDMQKRMMETIEQQTLYIIQLEDRLARMEKRMNELEAAR